MSEVKAEKPTCVAIAVSRFNTSITERLLEGALAQLADRGIAADCIEVMWVPGAVELPLLAQQFAMTEQFQAIICLGAVIRGETTHYDFVCQQVSLGCQQIMLQYNLPVTFGVLTTENEAQALARVGGDHGHKGRDAADAALDMIDLMQRFTVERRVVELDMK